MSRIRSLVMLCLFAAAGLVIVYVGGQWIISCLHQEAAGRQPMDYWRLLLSLSVFAFLALYLLRQLLACFIRWATRHRKVRILRFFQRVAPGLSRKIAGSMIGTSIALSGAAAATASPLPPTQDSATAISVPQIGLERSSTTHQATVPSPQWFPEALNIPLNQLIAPGAEKTREPKAELHEVVIAKGQNLWSVAAEHLGAQATPAEIAAYWPKIYKHNQHAIGADPDLVRIGTVLELPPLA